MNAPGSGVFEHFGQDLILLEKLAAGGMAEVYRAKQVGVGGFEKTVAVKRILPHYASNDEFKHMFRAEANLSALLQHPNIVSIFGNGEAEGYLYLLMEFVDGKNIRQLLSSADKRKVKLPIEFACYICAEAAKGLDYAHHFHDENTNQPMNIIHRDMSPQNVMLGYNGSVKIVDFGIAKAAATTETRAGVLKGKFGYMAPEQAGGMKLDKRVDVFALGIILFEMLTQRRLFTSDDDMRTLQLVRDCRVPRPSKYNVSVPPALDNIVMKALAKDRGDRYATCADFVADLQRFLNEQFPGFVPKQLSDFLKDHFKEDIEKERKKREKLAAEAPARLADAQRSGGAKPMFKDGANTKADMNRTQIEDMDATEITRPSIPGPGGDGREEITQLSIDGPAIQGDEAANVLQLSEGSAQATLNVAGGELPSPRQELNISRIDIPAPPRPSAVRADRGAPNKPKGMVLVLGLLLVGGAVAFVMMPTQNGGPSTSANEAPPEAVAPPVAGAESPNAAAENSNANNPAAANAGAPAAPVSDAVAPPAPPPPVAAVTANERPQNPLPAPTGGPWGYLTLRSVPAASGVEIDGEPLLDQQRNPMRTPIFKLPLRPGSHTITLRNPALGVKWEETVTIQEDRIAERSAILR